MQIDRGSNRRLQAQRLQVEAQPSGIDARRISQVVEDALEDRQLPRHQREEMFCGLAARRSLEHFERADQGMQGIAQLVPERRQEFVFPAGRRLAFDQVIFQRRHLCAQVGTVAQQLREADVPAVPVAQRDQDATDPDAPAILAGMPAIVLGPAELGGNLHLVDVELLGQVFFREDVAQGATDQLRRLVPEHPGDRRIGENDDRVQVHEQECEVFALGVPEREKLRQRTIRES